MDGAANWRFAQWGGPAAIAGAGGVDPNAAAPGGGDWRTQLHPEERNRIVNKIMETLKKHLPLSVPEGLSELHKIAVRFEEKIYTAAVNKSDYLRKISLKLLSMESQTKTQQNTGNAPGPAPGLSPQGSNPAQSSAILLMSQQQTWHANASTSVQGSLPSLGQNLSSVSQTLTLQNLSGMPENTMNNDLAQGTPQDMYAAQRQMAGRQQQLQQQQQAHNQLIYQQQKLLMNQKLQQNSLMQPHIQRQQILLQSIQMQYSQQPMMQISSSLQPGQTTIPQTQSMAMQSATQNAPMDSIAQTGHPGTGDSQGELYQMIKSLKDQYFAELNDLYNKISIKIQHIDNHMPAQMSAEQYEKMKGFKAMLERTLHFLQVNKSSIQPDFRERIPIYERQILIILSSPRRKPVQAPGQQIQQSGGQARSSDISQQHQTSQGLQQHDSHTYLELQTMRLADLEL